MSKVQHTLQADRDFYAAMFGEDRLICENQEKSSVEELLNSYDEAIYLYQLFLEEALLFHHDQSEIALLRRELQEAKCNKRRLLAI